MAIRKAIEQAKKNLIQPESEGHHDSASGSRAVRLGAGAAEARSGRNRHHRRRSGARGDGGCGNSNVLTKSIGTSNPHNVIKATFDALLRLKDVAKVAERASQDSGGTRRAKRVSGRTTSYGTKKTSGTLKIKWVVSFIACPQRHAADDSRPGIPPHATRWSSIQTRPPFAA